MTGNYIVFGLPFLTKYPTYQCRSEPDSLFMPCDRSEICSNKLDRDMWRIDYGSKESIHNWIDTLRLTCVSETVIGLLGSMYFVSFAISSAVVPNLADRFGRKWPFFYSLLVETMAYFGIYFSMNIW